MIWVWVIPSFTLISWSLESSLWVFAFMIVSCSHFLNIQMEKVEFFDWQLISNSIFLSSKPLRIWSKIIRALSTWIAPIFGLEACRNVQCRTQEVIHSKRNWWWSGVITRARSADSLLSDLSVLVNLPGPGMIALLIQWFRNLIFVSFVAKSEHEGVVSY